MIHQAWIAKPDFMGRNGVVDLAGAHRSLISPKLMRAAAPEAEGSHVMWGIFDKDGNELARGSVTTHPGDMSWTVIRGFEADFEDLSGKG